MNNNESTKHIDQKIINIFKYYSANSKSAIEFKKNNDQQISSITAKNGNDYLLQNINKENIFFNSLHDKKELLIDKIKKCKDDFVEDYVVNLNSILLNSSFDFILKENSPIPLCFPSIVNKFLKIVDQYGKLNVIKTNMPKKGIELKDTLKILNRSHF